MKDFVKDNFSICKLSGPKIKNPLVGPGGKGHPREIQLILFQISTQSEVSFEQGALKLVVVTAKIA
jgi:hypothetical protein